LRGIGGDREEEEEEEGVLFWKYRKLMEVIFGIFERLGNIFIKNKKKGRFYYKNYRGV
jgi:hypothetical protein